MTNRIRLTLGYPPSANRYYRVDRRGFAYVSTDARRYKNSVRLSALAQQVKPLDGPLVMSLVVYRPRRIGDLSNRIKVLEDSLIGVAFKDDGQIEEIHAVRMDDASNPRVEVCIEQLPPPRAV